VLAILVAGCGSKKNAPAQPPQATAPVTGQKGNEVPQQGPPLGYPVIASKNTTRVAGGDAIADAAAVALAVFPEGHPQAVVLADVNDWRTGLVASVLFSAPVKAPILFTQGDKIPQATQAALDR